MLTLKDIRNKEFTTVRLREGYDQVEVDAFLERVEDAFTQLEDLALVRNRSDGEKASRVLSVAQDTADRVVAEAKAEAAAIVARGHQEADAYLAEVRANAEAARKDALDRQHAEIAALEMVRQELDAKVNGLKQTHENHIEGIKGLIAGLSNIVPDEAETQALPVTLEKSDDTA